MDLGISTLRRNGLNALSCAVHPQHGVAYTDGKAIYLAPLSISQQEVVNAKPTKLGQFEFVQSLQWSTHHTDPHCYLCVVHQSHVKIWKAEGPANNLDFKQVRKINATPIPQGCLWNPHRDILCIVNKEQCSFYFRHTQNKGNFSLPPIERGKLSCGAWSSDGTSLLVGVGSVILIYQWRDIDKSISDYAIIAWRIPNVSGSISNLVAMADGKVACTVDNLQLTSPMLDLKGVGDGMKREVCLSDSEGDYELVKLGHDEPLSQSANLLESAKVGDACCQLIVFELQSGMVEPQKLACHSIPGIITPDLLHIQNHSIIVGSSNCHTLFACSWISGKFALQPMSLGKEEHPKGVGHVLGGKGGKKDGLLVMVGVPLSDPTFSGLSSYSQYHVSLRYMPMLEQAVPSEDVFKELQLSDRNNKVHLLSVNPLQTNPLQSTRNGTPESQRNATDGQSSGSTNNSQNESYNSVRFANVNSHGSSNSNSPKRGSDTPQSGFVRYEGSNVNVDLSGKSLLPCALVGGSNTTSPASQKSRKIELLSPSNEQQELDTHTVDFKDQECHFKNNIEDSFAYTSVALGGVGDGPKTNANRAEIRQLETSVETSERERRQNIGTLFSPNHSQHDRIEGRSAGRDTDSETCSDEFSDPLLKDSVISGSYIASQLRSVKDVKNPHYRKPQQQPPKIPQRSPDLTSFLTMPPESRSVGQPGKSRSPAGGQSGRGEEQSEVCRLEELMKEQGRKIEMLQDKMTILTEMLEHLPGSTGTPTSPTSSPPPPRPDNPPRVRLGYSEHPSHHLRDQNGGESLAYKWFLLDARGRLHADTVKEAFGLVSLELLVDGEPCVMGTDKDGLIPLRFVSQSTVHITGKCFNHSDV